MGCVIPPLFLAEEGRRAEVCYFDSAVCELAVWVDQVHRDDGVGRRIWWLDGGFCQFVRWGLGRVRRTVVDVAYT